MIDIHSHFLYGLDDGAEDEEETLAMLRQYIESGFTGVVATPHFDTSRYVVTKNLMEERLEEVRKLIKRENLDIEIYPGNEIHLDFDTLDKLESGELSTLAGSRYVLIELPFFSKPNYAQDLIYRIQLAGYVVILAHCERYKYVQENTDFLLPFIKSGALVQINLTSLRESSSAYDTAIKLLERQMVHLVGTDAHSNQGRSADVKKELGKFKELAEESGSYDTIRENQKKVVLSQHISSNYDNIMIEKTEKRRGFFDRFFKK